MRKRVGRPWKTHGLTGSPEYRVWARMIDRCERSTRDHFHRYGGRGIRVCPRWRESFEAFLEDMGALPSPRHSLDRKDNDGNYEPGNCRWATREEQVRNRSNTHWLSVNGERLCLRDWARRAGISETTLLNRIRRGWSLKDAVSYGPRQRPKMRSVTFRIEQLPSGKWRVRRCDGASKKTTTIASGLTEAEAKLSREEALRLEAERKAA